MVCRGCPDVGARLRPVGSLDFKNQNFCLLNYCCMADIPTFTSPTPRRPLSTVLLVVISLVAGMLGAVLLLWFVPAIRTTRIPPGTQSVIVEQPGQVVVEESARIRDLRDQNLRLVGSIAKASGTLTVGGATMYPTSS